MKTNLLPQEIVVERVIRAKKPWVLAAVSLLLLGCSLGLFYKTLAADLVKPETTDAAGKTWKEALASATKESKASKRFISDDEEQKLLLDKFNVISTELSSSIEDRASWIEIYSALYQAMPRDEKIEQALKASGTSAVDPKEFPFDQREEIYVDHIETAFKKDLGEWYAEIQPIFANQLGRTADQFGNEPVAAPLENLDPNASGSDVSFDDDTEGGAVTTGLAGKPGWVIEIQAHHFHNTGMVAELDFVRQKLLNNLLNGVVKLPDGEFTYDDLGISFPTVTRVSPSSTPHIITIGGDEMDGMGMGMGMGMGGNKFGGAGMGMSMGMGGPGGPGADGMGAGSTVASDDENTFNAKIYTFIIQMAWTPRTVEERNAAKKAREDAAAQAAAAAAAQAQAAAEQQ